MSPAPVLVMLTDPTLMGKRPVTALDPENVIVKGPPFVAVMLPLLRILFAFTVIPIAEFVLMLLLIVIVPLVSVILIEEDVIA
jgi:hypothetical protein